MQRRSWIVWMFVTGWCLSGSLAHAQLSFQVTEPLPQQVIQRQGYVPQWAAKQPVGGPAWGFADVAIDCIQPEFSGKTVTQARVVLLEGATGVSTDWATCTVTQAGKTVARIPAGGWYRLEVRILRDTEILAAGAVEPIGVGEVFVVAGQSYATNTNEQKHQVQDPLGRVVAFDSKAGTWGIAHDPQPAGDNSDGGSIWPPLGDALLAKLQVPVAFANVAVGGTSSTQWLPEGELHQRLVRVGQTLGRFRGVLWQQGESDVIAHAPTADYVTRVTAIRTAAAQAWNFEPLWLLAKSTLHPTVYNDPEGEGRIRAAIDELVKLPGFRAGPDTDTLAGENRGGPQSRRHFSAIGQQRAAEMWHVAIQQQLFDLISTHEAALANIDSLKLYEAANISPTVNRESSVLIQATPESAPTARLAFPAREILDIATADRLHHFVLGQDAALSEDGLTLTFTKFAPLEPISAADFFPPEGAPHSYRHRVGHPEQNLLYRPGRWFHDHNIEVTYVRRDAPVVPAAAETTAPLARTIARLKARQPLTIGVSGDSISTGLDASALTQAAPYQLGYPDLVGAQLQTTFGSEIRVRNRAVSGWSVANGVQDLDKLLEEHPHLIIVAYGMNDVGRRDPAWYGEQTKIIVDRIQQALPECDIVLVSTMLGHSEWIHTPREMFPLYREELRKLTGPGVALADVTELWTELLQHKHDFDLTGNGLNHPNDFGHRLYAQQVLQLLPSQP